MKKRIPYDRGIYILVDEYDYHTNELLTVDVERYKNTYRGNSFIRNFFTIIKIGTGQGSVSSLFSSGVTSITLDGMTSGFNIGIDLTRIIWFDKMFGFTEGEVKSILQYYEVADSDTVLADLTKYYGGYCFNPKTEGTLFNTNDVWYFMKQFVQNGSYPTPISALDLENAYAKIKAIFSLISEKEVQQILDAILTDKGVRAVFVHQYSFQRSFDYYDIISLLYYNGFLAMRETLLGSERFVIPNDVLRKLFQSIVP